MLRKLSGVRSRIVAPVTSLALAVLATSGLFLQTANAQSTFPDPCVPIIDPGCHNGETKDYYIEKLDGDAPVINGQVDPGEWDEALGGGGNWHNLRTGTDDVSQTEADPDNWQFKMLWDDEALYILVRGDKGFHNWNPAIVGTAGSTFNNGNINVYLDPNNDGEQRFRVNGDIDAYHAVWDITEGYGHSANASETLGGTPPVGGGLFANNYRTFFGAGSNGPFENRAWNFDDGSEGNQEAHFGDTDSAVMEIRWTWDNFNVSVPEPDDGTDPGLDQMGLAPELLDEWFVNITNITGGPQGNNFLPMWNWQDQTSFTFQPHGVGIFVDGGPPSDLAGDGNGDGKVDGLDYLLWAAAFGDDPAADPPGSPENGDYDNDGKVDGLDYLVWAGNFGAGVPATDVPEPGTLALACLALTSLFVTRRRRS